MADGRLICIDGPAGSGKTTLAGALGVLGARVVHLDDLYDGWTGLPRVPGQLRALLGPLAQGHPGGYRRYDWVNGRKANAVRVPPSEVLVVEGVGAGSAPPELITVLVWIEVSPELRLTRGLARDGVEAEPHWRSWMLEEAAHFATYGTRERADLLLDGNGGTDTVPADGLTYRLIDGSAAETVRSGRRTRESPPGQASTRLPQ